MSTETIDKPFCDHQDKDKLSLSIPDLPDEVQRHADTMLGHLAGQGLTPKIEMQGHPITIAVKLAKEFQAFTPQHLTEASQSLLGFLVDTLTQYAEDTHAATLSFDFNFIRGA